MTDARGAALIDIIVAVALSGVMAAIAVPVIGGTLDRERTIIGAQYLGGQLMRARLYSLKQARSVAVRRNDPGLGKPLLIGSPAACLHPKSGLIRQDERADTPPRSVDPPQGPAYGRRTTTV